jgi:type IV fimbrial biogenesis protein FimT
MLITNKKHQGVTLIELMMTIAIMAIILTIGIPSLQNMLANNRLTTLTNSMVGALNIARSESVKRNQLLVVRKSGTHWKDGWQVFVDSNKNHSLDAGELVIQEYATLPNNYFIKSSFINYVSYRPDGRSNTNGNFYFCSSDKESLFRKIVIHNSGRIRIEQTEQYANVCN